MIALPVSAAFFTESCRLLPQLSSVPRRAVLQTAAAAAAAKLLPQPLPAAAISATTMSGKTKPDLGVILPEEVKGGDKGPISADLVLSNGVMATVAFESVWPLAEGNYYDIASKNKDGEVAFVQVANAGSTPLAKLPKSFFSKSVLGLSGFYGAYGEPIDSKWVDVSPSSSAVAGARTLECSFTPLGPSGEGSPRKGVVTAVQPAGASDVVMLVSTSSATRWKKANAEAGARRAADSFRVVATRPTALKQEAPSDYRYGRASGPSSMTSRNDGF